MPKEKSAKKTAVKRDIVRIKGSVVPIAFEEFVRRMCKHSEVNHGRSVSTFSDNNGKFVTIPRLGSLENKICLFMNKSRGWKPEIEFTEDIVIDKWYTGDVRVIVTDNLKSIKEAVRICNLWRAERIEFAPRPSKARAKAAKKHDEEEDSGSNGTSKKHKKHKKHVEVEANA